MKIAFGGVLTGAGFVATFFTGYSTLVGRLVGLTSGEMLIAGIVTLVSGLILIFLDAGSANRE